MSPVVDTITSAELLTASESNRIAFWSAYGRAAGSRLRATAQAVWFYTGIPEPLFNGVLSARLQAAEVGATVNELQTEIDARGAPALWWLGPDATTFNLGALLEEHGLLPAGEVPGMAVDLAAVADQPEPTPNFTLQRVADVEMQALWAQIVAVGTGFPEAATAALVRLERSLADPAYKEQRRYIGWLNGKPVATSALILEAGVAGIYAVATLPEARRQGIGRLMTVRPLLEARQMGYCVGILQASSMGYPVYHQIGFQTVYEFRIYFQPPTGR